MYMQMDGLLAVVAWFACLCPTLMVFIICNNKIPHKIWVNNVGKLLTVILKETNQADVHTVIPTAS